MLSQRRKRKRNTSWYTGSRYAMNTLLAGGVLAGYFNPWTAAGVAGGVAIAGGYASKKVYDKAKGALKWRKYSKRPEEVALPEDDGDWGDQKDNAKMPRRRKGMKVPKNRRGTKRKRRMSRKALRRREKAAVMKIKKIVQNEIYKRSNLTEKLQQQFKTGSKMEATTNNVAYFNYFAGQKTELEGLFNNEYIVRGTAGLNTIDLSSTTAEVHEALINHKNTLEMRNNGIFTAQLDIYKIMFKEGANTDPSVYVQQGLDQLATPATNPETYTGYYPRYSEQFRKHCMVLSYNRVYLGPGSNKVVYMRTKPHYFATTTFNDNNLPKYTTCIMIRIQGTTGYGLEGVGYSPANVDVIQTRHYWFRFKGGRQVKRYKFDDTGLAAVIDQVDEDLGEGENMDNA